LGGGGGLQSEDGKVYISVVLGGRGLQSEEGKVYISIF